MYGVLPRLARRGLSIHILQVVQVRTELRFQ